MSDATNTHTTGRRLVRKAGSGWSGAGADREWRGDKYDSVYCFLDPDTRGVVGMVDKMDDIGNKGKVWYYEVLSENPRTWGRYFDTLRDAERYFRMGHARSGT